LSEIQEAETNLLLGRCWRYEGTGDAGKKAVLSLEESLRIYEKLGNINKLGEVYSFLATVYDHFGHGEKAADAFGKSQINFNLANDSIGLAKLQRKSGIIYESRRAIEFMKNALDAFERYSMKIEKARCLNNMGAESFYIAKFDDAEKYLGSSLEIFRNLDSPEVDIPLNNLGLVYQQRGDYTKALQFFEDANANVSELFNEVFVNMNIANVLKQTGKLERARKVIVHLEPLILSYPEGLMNDYYGLNRASTHYELDELDEAQTWLEKFKPHSYKHDDELILAKRFLLLSKILDKKGHIKGSVEAAKKSSEIFKTERPQKWFYKLDYYPCDIHLWD
ncbi:MAG: tetratricopeptide repeat protein, partial [Nitrosotalea sp.]